MVMESRHLLGVFLGIVVLCGVFFTLGYLLGRTQYDVSVRAAVATQPEKPPATSASATTTAAKPAAPLPGPAEWDFYRATQPKKAEESLKLPASRPAATSSSTNVATSFARSWGILGKTTSDRPAPKLKAPLIPRAAIALQVAALRRQTDASALAQVLQQKRYPAFVLPPSSDNLYRVQIGPYADTQSAEQTKRALERDGFKTITKR